MLIRLGIELINPHLTPLTSTPLSVTIIIVCQAKRTRRIHFQVIQELSRRIHFPVIQSGLEEFVSTLSRAESKDNVEIRQPPELNCIFKLKPQDFNAESL